MYTWNIWNLFFIWISQHVHRNKLTRIFQVFDNQHSPNFITHYSFGNTYTAASKIGAYILFLENTKSIILVWTSTIVNYLLIDNTRGREWILHIILVDVLRTTEQWLYNMNSSTIVTFPRCKTINDPWNNNNINKLYTLCTLICTCDFV